MGILKELVNLQAEETALKQPKKDETAPDILHGKVLKDKPMTKKPQTNFGKMKQAAKDEKVAQQHLSKKPFESKEEK